VGIGFLLVCKIFKLREVRKNLYKPYGLQILHEEHYLLCFQIFTFVVKSYTLDSLIYKMILHKMGLIFFYIYFNYKVDLVLFREEAKKWIYKPIDPKILLEIYRGAMEFFIL